MTENNTKVNPTEEVCAGQCKHSLRYHVVKIIGSTDLACCKMDCACMKFVKKKP